MAPVRSEQRAAIPAVVREVAAAVGIAEGEAGIRSVLAVVAEREPVAVRAISLETELPVPIVAAICNELRARGVVAPGAPVRLAEQARSSLRPIAVDPDDLDVVRERLEASAEAAPSASVEIDQSHCTVDTKVRRVLALHAARALLWRRVLILGDDDLTSLAVAEVLRHAGAQAEIPELAVVDVDERILEFLEPRLAALGVDATLVLHDLREPLPADLRGRFDTVFTDPPYTAAGAELFLSRAVTALAGPGADVFFAFGARNPDELVKTQAAIAGMGLVVRSLVRNFNEYVGAGILGGTSHLYHLTTTAATAPAVDAPYAGPLYTGDTPRPPRRYVCAACGEPQPVGPTARFTTVHELSSAGCPRCGGTSFRPGPRRS
jgi:predicted methyltransferase